MREGNFINCLRFRPFSGNGARRAGVRRLPWDSCGEDGGWPSHAPKGRVHSKNSVPANDGEGCDGADRAVLHRPQQHVLLAAERRLDHAARLQGLAGDERLLVAERGIVDA